MDASGSPRPERPRWVGSVASLCSVDARGLRNPSAVERLIRARAEVSSQLLLLAKAHLIDHCTGEMSSQLDGFTASIGARRVDRVVIHPTVDVEASVDAVARHLSATIALGEAVWALIVAETAA